MKHFLTLLGILILIDSYAQSCLEEETPEEEVEAIPWVQDSTFIDDFINERIGTAPNARSTTLTHKYYIPMRITIYRDGSGDPNSAIPDSRVLEAVNEMNTLFDEANTGIRFFVREINFVNNNFYRENVRTLIQVVGDLFDWNKKEGVVNVHMVRDVGGLAPGYAIIP